MLWLAIGDWHLVTLEEDTGEVTERLKMVVEGRSGVRPAVQVPAAGGPSGLLNRLLRLGVLVGVLVSLGENVGRGAWNPDRGEATRSGENAAMEELVLGSPKAGSGPYSAAPLVGLRGSCGDIGWALKGEGKEAFLEKDWDDGRFLDCGAPLGRLLMGSLTGLRMKREAGSWYGRCLDSSISNLEQPFSKRGASGIGSGAAAFCFGFWTTCWAFRFCES
ncbi:hypothetical protein EYF80_056549 [Liparis tanakae]|uniref:Uncharacterized protein n=1 Tax=Liparis tanakae TaxID=230148 RepID=A0A4Z2EWU5_9TELE|nr:hypothetical protein EYF80_056549 [Liparis tanakae]